jgi:hypothetical protein
MGKSNPASPYYTRLLQSTDRPSWNRLFTDSPFRTPFADPVYGQQVALALNRTMEFVGVFEDDQLIGGVQLCVKKTGPFRTAHVPAFTSFTPILFEQALPESQLHDQTSPLDALLNDLQTRYASTHLHLPPAWSDMRTFQWNGWSVRPLYTYQVDLTNADSLQSNWSTGTRRLFRQAETDYDVDETTEADAVVTWVGRSYERQERKLPVEPHRLKSLIMNLQQAGLVRIFTATKKTGSTPEAALALLHDETTAYYWVAGSTPGAAMTILLGRVFDRLQQDGFKTFDFVGANTPSIAEFKRRFGSMLIPYYRATFERSTLTRLISRLLR